MEHQGSPLSFFKKFLFLKVILFINYIGVKLTYNVVLVSGVKQSESVFYIYIYAFYFRFFSHTGYYRVLSRVHCAIQ